MAKQYIYANNIKNQVANITEFETETFQYVDTYPIHTKMTSQKNITLTVTLTIIQNPKFGPRIPNPNTKLSNGCNRRLSGGLALGLGILDQALNLTQSGVSVTNAVILSTILFMKQDVRTHLVSPYVGKCYIILNHNDISAIRRTKFFCLYISKEGTMGNRQMLQEVLHHLNQFIHSSKLTFRPCQN